MPSPSWLACSEWRALSPIRAPAPAHSSRAYSAQPYASVIAPRGSQPLPLATCGPGSPAARSEPIRRPVGVPSPRERPDASRAESLAQRVDLAPPSISRFNSPATLRPTLADSPQDEYRAARSIHALGTNSCPAADGSRPEVGRPHAHPPRDGKTDAPILTPRPRQEALSSARTTDEQLTCKPNDQVVPTRARPSAHEAPPAPRSADASLARRIDSQDASIRALGCPEDAPARSSTNYRGGTRWEVDREARRVKPTPVSTAARLPPLPSPSSACHAPPAPSSPLPSITPAPSLHAQPSISRLGSTAIRRPSHASDPQDEYRAEWNVRSLDTSGRPAIVSSRPEVVQPHARPLRDSESHAPRSRQEVPPSARTSGAQHACKPDGHAVPTRARAATQDLQTNGASRACKTAPLDASTCPTRHPRDARTIARTSHREETSREVDGQGLGVRLTPVSTTVHLPPSPSPSSTRYAPSTSPSPRPPSARAPSFDAPASSLHPRPSAAALPLLPPAFAAHPSPPSISGFPSREESAALVRAHHARETAAAERAAFAQRYGKDTPSIPLLGNPSFDLVPSHSLDAPAPSRLDLSTSIHTPPAGSLQHEYRAVRTLRSLGTSGCPAVDGSRPEVEQRPVQSLHNGKLNASTPTPRLRQEAPSTARTIDAQRTYKSDEQAAPTRARASTDKAPQDLQINARAPSARKSAEPTSLELFEMGIEAARRSLARTSSCEGPSKSPRGTTRTEIERGRGENRVAETPVSRSIPLLSPSAPLHTRYAPPSSSNASTASQTRAYSLARPPAPFTRGGLASPITPSPATPPGHVPSSASTLSQHALSTSSSTAHTDGRQDKYQAVWNVRAPGTHPAVSVPSLETEPFCDGEAVPPTRASKSRKEVPSAARTDDLRRACTSDVQAQSTHAETYRGSVPLGPSVNSPEQSSGGHQSSNQRDGQGEERVESTPVSFAIPRLSSSSPPSRTTPLRSSDTPPPDAPSASPAFIRPPSPDSHVKRSATSLSTSTLHPPVMQRAEGTSLPRRNLRTDPSSLDALPLASPCSLSSLAADSRSTPVGITSEDEATPITRTSRLEDLSRGHLSTSVRGQEVRREETRVGSTLVSIPIRLPPPSSTSHPRSAPSTPRPPRPRSAPVPSNCTRPFDGSTRPSVRSSGTSMSLTDSPAQSVGLPRTPPPDSRSTSVDTTRKDELQGEYRTVWNVRASGYNLAASNDTPSFSRLDHSATSKVLPVDDLLSEYQAVWTLRAPGTAASLMLEVEQPHGSEAGTPTRTPRLPTRARASEDDMPTHPSIPHSRSALLPSNCTPLFDASTHSSPRSSDTSASSASPVSLSPPSPESRPSHSTSTGSIRADGLQGEYRTAWNLRASSNDLAASDAVVNTAAKSSPAEDEQVASFRAETLEDGASPVTKASRQESLSGGHLQVGTSERGQEVRKEETRVESTLVSTTVPCRSSSPSSPNTPSSSNAPRLHPPFAASHPPLLRVELASPSLASAPLEHSVSPPLSAPPPDSRSTLESATSEDDPQGEHWAVWNVRAPSKLPVLAVPTFEVERTHARLRSDRETDALTRTSRRSDEVPRNPKTSQPGLASGGPPSVTGVNADRGGRGVGNTRPPSWSDMPAFPPASPSLPLHSGHRSALGVNHTEDPQDEHWAVRNRRTPGSDSAVVGPSLEVEHPRSNIEASIAAPTGNTLHARNNAPQVTTTCARAGEAPSPTGTSNKVQTSREWVDVSRPSRDINEGQRRRIAEIASTPIEQPSPSPSPCSRPTHPSVSDTSTSSLSEYWAAWSRRAPGTATGSTSKVEQPTVQGATAHAGTKEEDPSSIARTIRREGSRKEVSGARPLDYEVNEQETRVVTTASAALQPSRCMPSSSGSSGRPLRPCSPLSRAAHASSLERPMLSPTPPCGSSPPSPSISVSVSRLGRLATHGTSPADDPSDEDWTVRNVRTSSTRSALPSSSVLQPDASTSLPCTISPAPRPSRRSTSSSTPSSPSHVGHSATSKVLCTNIPLSDYWAAWTRRAPGTTANSEREAECPKSEVEATPAAQMNGVSHVAETVPQVTLTCAEAHKDVSLSEYWAAWSRRAPSTANSSTSEVEQPSSQAAEARAGADEEDSGSIARTNGCKGSRWEVPGARTLSWEVDRQETRVKTTAVSLPIRQPSPPSPASPPPTSFLGLPSAFGTSCADGLQDELRAVRDHRTPSSCSEHPPSFGMQASTSASPSPPSRLGVSTTLGANIADDPSDEGWTVRNVRTSSIHVSSYDHASRPPSSSESSGRPLRPCSPLPWAAHTSSLDVDCMSLNCDHHVPLSSTASLEDPSRRASPSMLDLFKPVYDRDTCTASSAQFSSAVSPSSSPRVSSPATPLPPLCLGISRTPGTDLADDPSDEGRTARNCCASSAHYLTSSAPQLNSPTSTHDCCEDADSSVRAALTPSRLLCGDTSLSSTLPSSNSSSSESSG
ncbi:uncharacterized protein B0H18DRAFT_1198491 [Fomitopsis serialis]|uniref:uncharacterized protein n=1 Tax=Fomitopsis serialis TaxID=139415 RepID=UPI0020081D3E|nr:uncharacterized protein B0H18DRAFT_1198491 [Neoantrodia serialis]KAH9918682.1 hypothetical protein B0H18DRAFT_1198491 [Neoantrodia serialis]